MAKKFLEDSIQEVSEKEKPFEPINFWMMGGCVILIILGFLFMSGSGSSIEEGFNPDIFSARRIIVGPLLSFLGFLFMAVAIIWKPGKNFRFGKTQKKDENVETRNGALKNNVADNGEPVSK